MNFTASLVYVFIVGVIVGWILAHQEVSTECARQGSFYVGKNDFKCELIRSEKPKQ
jgi:hypothetical protein